MMFFNYHNNTLPECSVPNGFSNGITSTFHLSDKITNTKTDEKLEFVRCLAMENLIGSNNLNILQNNLQQLWNYKKDEDGKNLEIQQARLFNEEFCQCDGLYFLYNKLFILC